MCIRDRAYADLPDPNLAKMVIGLRTPDYGELLPRMLNTLDEANRENQRYGGWARHSYNDYLKAVSYTHLDVYKRQAQWRSG